MTGIHTLLLVDDDRTLASILSMALEAEGYSVRVAHNGLLGWRAFQEDTPDLIILDILMPEMDGLEVCRRIRKESNVPIIMLSSRGEEVDRITGLETGADDYLTKPFSTRELCARIKVIGRRLQPPGAPAVPPVLTCGGLRLDQARFEVRWKEQPITLTVSEFRILEALARSPGFVLSRDRILDLARGEDVVVTDRTVDTVIKRLRKKFRDVDDSFEHIETVFGVGYRWRKDPA